MEICYFIVELFYVILISFCILELVSCQLFIILILVTPVLLFAYAMILVSVCYIEINGVEEEQNVRNPFFGIRICIHVMIAYLIYYLFFFDAVDRNNNCFL